MTWTMHHDPANDRACPWAIHQGQTRRYACAEESDARLLLHLLRTGGSTDAELPSYGDELLERFRELCEQAGGQRPAARLLRVDERRLRGWLQDPPRQALPPLAAALLQHLLAIDGNL